ncbi:adenylosuccinate synthetase [Flavobacterium azooxidireducens]|uniref:Adenylosuccinate synthetase n=1 Tax=Flavobacterium azooxidireducens TaxID=1871076 RepID=A0ABY4KBK1_9FLAO|nr:adenylosuccinate synthetase [Flavobacterium azooxidireducens]UPQ78159.1 adenylosuccinate synthetase [Flavobacterium azooxidireducens]
MKKCIRLFILLISGFVFAQKPSEIPGDTGKVELTETSDIIIYILIPIIIIILYFVWKKRKKNGSE